MMQWPTTTEGHGPLSTGIDNGCCSPETWDDVSIPSFSEGAHGGVEVSFALKQELGDLGRYYESSQGRSRPRHLPVIYTIT